METKVVSRSRTPSSSTYMFKARNNIHLHWKIKIFKWENLLVSLLIVINVHTDAAWKETDKKAGLAWIFSDHTGKFWPKELQQNTSSPLVAEGMAIREALLQAQAFGYSKLLIKSDAQTIIRAINGRDSIKELFGILQDIHNLSCYLSVSRFCFIPRLDNIAANTLAKRALATTMVT